METTRFITYILKVYEDDNMTVGEALKYTEMYKKLFPNLWSSGDSFDREKVSQSRSSKLFAK